jgi:hypothetical protein
VGQEELASHLLLKTVRISEMVKQVRDFGCIHGGIVNNHVYVYVT